MSQPLCTVPVKVDQDQMFVPDAFADELVPMLSALDWARVYNAAGRGSYGPLAQELAAVARHARALADLAESFASAADAARVD